jgi:MOSC domain-containing protein YiiM
MTSAPVPRLISVQVGLPAVHGQVEAEDGRARPWRSGYWKSPVAGPVWLGRTNLAGDGQANRKVHGGPDKAVLAYAACHYPDWRRELEASDLPFGAFAENFTVTFQHEGNVCLGDVYTVGGARLEVSQPRQPCQNITRRWQRPGLMERVRETGRHGWYLRVLEEGSVEAGQPLELLERPCPDWTVARATSIMSQRAHDRHAAASLAEVPALADSWREMLGQR